LTTSNNNGMKQSWVYCLVLSAALWLPGTLMAEAYKWVDESGRVHYTQVKPTVTTTNTQFAPEKSSIETVGAPPPVASPTEDSNTEFNQQIEEKTASIEKAKQEAEMDKRRARNEEITRENCATATRNLKLIHNARRLAYRNEANERVYMDDAERARREALAKKNIELYCK